MIISVSHHPIHSFRSAVDSPPLTLFSALCAPSGDLDHSEQVDQPSVKRTDDDDDDEEDEETAEERRARQKPIEPISEEKDQRSYGATDLPSVQE